MVTKVRLARRSPDQRREHIIDVAKDAFLNDGYAATSMSTIADLLGGSKATLYKYFPSKEALFEAMMERHCAAAFAVLTENILPEDDIRGLLQGFGRRYLRKLSDTETLKLARLVHGEGVRVPEVARAFFAHGPDRGHGYLAERLAAMRDKGLIACVDPLLTAQQFLGMVRGDVHMRQVCGLIDPPSESQIDHLVDHAVALVVPALEKVEGQPA